MRNENLTYILRYFRDVAEAHGFDFLCASYRYQPNRNAAETLADP